MSSSPPRNRAAVVAALVSAVLAVAKLSVGVYTGSVSVIASGLDSTLDVLASGLNAWAIRAAIEPPDEHHRFGHGKLESLAALAQATFVGGSAVLVTLEAGGRWQSEATITHPHVALLTVALSTLVALALVIWQRREYARTGSMAVAADSAHYLSDVLSGIAVMAAVAASSFLGLGFIDPVVSLGVAALMLFTGLNLARKAIDTLLDPALPEVEVRLIEETLRGFKPPLLGWHGLRTRSDGVNRFVEVHLELDGDLSLRAANEVYGDVVAALGEALPGVDLSIHLDPADEPDPIVRR